ncbi:acyl-CoA dehydrogenase family protein [Sutcliffiella horikoshii]|uniref:Acyl-CoA dehydrogenase n=1 Tax=Sutcliffiella horikoshii TaxID=79883 RepID=A0A5D4SZD8_9BACI|nr:acyl-CoA dehydrogenase family protein [Sutcliffiella horikoshii]TYS68595.1 acyl-CoA dehydrogenase [Sutcliffiella horikoshii]
MNEIRSFARTEEQEHIYSLASSLASDFSTRAGHYDQNAVFPFENFQALKDAGVLDLTIPKKYGGKGAGLYDFVLLQETIAQGDGPTALSLGWHLGIMMNEGINRSWPQNIYEMVCQDIVQHKKLINSAHSERKTGSPARGGKPETVAKKHSNGGWVINGRKNFTSLAPVLDYFIISASVEGTEDVGEFLLPRELKGISIEETWNSMSMRATRSDDLVLSEVMASKEALLYIKKKKSPKPQGWLLHIPACYLGIAIAARNEAVSFADSYHPNSLPHPIREVPKVRERVAKMDVELTAARHLLYSVARLWDEEPDKREELIGELAIAKLVATNSAISIVDEAMRILGAQSLHAKHPLQRHYRDVRAGLHNPPADEITMELLAKQAFLKES